MPEHAPLMGALRVSGRTSARYNSLFTFYSQLVHRFRDPHRSRWSDTICLQRKLNPPCFSFSTSLHQRLFASDGVRLPPRCEDDVGPSVELQSM